MTPVQQDVEGIAKSVLAGRAGRKSPSTVAELHMLVAEVLVQQSAAQGGGAVPVSTGGLSAPDAARFDSLIERLKKDGLLETSWRPGN